MVTDAVSLVDVAPTLLALLGLPPEPRFEGRSLLESLASAGESPDIVLQLQSTSNVGRRHTAGLVHGRQKLLMGPPLHPRELYDLAVDPGETHPNPSALAPHADALEARLTERERSLATRSGSPMTVPVDPAVRDRLRALGYVP